MYTYMKTIMANTRDSKRIARPTWVMIKAYLPHVKAADEAPRCVDHATRLAWIKVVDADGPLLQEKYFLSEAYSKSSQVGLSSWKALR